ncbi:hypothetical protein PSE10A_53210 [Pseudomonas amygdali pv. eriobotryae]|uniref:Uncharacterized protein n=1 Tax=Pseudomonas amygdali pv. eriobotryae TaxID=129137 RepID=A0A9P3EFC9_PSEA0|nr:hypothetical protein PSE10A_53210 [Pseudomonas amygdali pv. eriobotryae]
MFDDKRIAGSCIADYKYTINSTPCCVGGGQLGGGVTEDKISASLKVPDWQFGARYFPVEGGGFESYR